MRDAKFGGVELSVVSFCLYFSLVFSLQQRQYLSHVWSTRCPCSSIIARTNGGGSDALSSWCSVASWSRMRMIGRISGTMGVSCVESVGSRPPLF